MFRALRCLPLLALLLLGACQNMAWSDAGRAQVRERQQFERMLSAGELVAAGENLEELRTLNDPKLEEYQRQLAEAWILRSQQALERGDVNEATTALARARALMPKAPALTGGSLPPPAPAEKREGEDEGEGDSGDDVVQ